MVDKGYNQYFKFIIMPYTGKSLDYIKETIVKGEFAPHTAIQIALQTHRALKNLHEQGYIHRDVKPDNFVVGKYVLSREHLTRNQAYSESRYKFIGTPKYAARATHMGRVVNRKEDMESWYYMVIELFGTDYLPWSNVENLDTMFYMKDLQSFNRSRTISTI
ncbi:hypothetical protein ANCCEY_14517 [Ancylostoma ceylanicum]|uniref:non-specific serine/threonine protein kinase n=1 Tax=Ancylostoma ceylanicum TaxID=53326 RepID=A0A0D6LFG8_9BILA|nr:hypothetical protein ANCCEY_14517 [Ancylostoma ceylanicum]